MYSDLLRTVLRLYIRSQKWNDGVRLPKKKHIRSLFGAQKLYSFLFDNYIIQQCSKFNVHSF